MALRTAEGTEKEWRETYPPERAFQPREYCSSAMRPGCGGGDKSVAVVTKMRAAMMVTLLLPKSDAHILKLTPTTTTTPIPTIQTLYLLPCDLITHSAPISITHLLPSGRHHGVVRVWPSPCSDSSTFSWQQGQWGSGRFVVCCVQRGGVLVSAFILTSGWWW